MAEPASLMDRLDKWDDFRSCTVRTYVARKREADKRAREGTPRPSRHASIGDETIEECGVQMAVAKKETAVCERLAVDYQEPSGDMPLSAVRCWDTRARVFGLPDECPVVWMPSDAPARNPECLAMARRDQSLCPFTDSPGRCRALLTNDPASCDAPDGSPDCMLALEYWRGTLPTAFGPAAGRAGRRSRRSPWRPPSIYAGRRASTPTSGSRAPGPRADLLAGRSEQAGVHGGHHQVLGHHLAAGGRPDHLAAR